MLRLGAPQLRPFAKLLGEVRFLAATLLYPPSLRDRAIAIIAIDPTEAGDLACENLPTDWLGVIKDAGPESWAWVAPAMRLFAQES